MTESSNFPQSPAGDSQQPATSHRGNDSTADPAVASQSGKPEDSSAGAGAQASPAEPLTSGAPASGEASPPPPAGYGQPPYGYGAQPGYGQPPYGYGAQPGYGQPPYPAPVPGQFPGSGGYGMMPPDASRKRRKSWIIWLSVAAVILVLCCGCGAGISYLVYRSLEFERDRASESTQEYLDALREQRFDKAYDLMCDRNKNRDGQTEQEFIAEQQASPKLRNYDVQGVALSGGNDADFTVKVRQELDNGTSRTERIPVVTDGDDLRPCP